MILSFVRSNGANQVGFLADQRRINVAITRAKRQCVIIGDSETISHDAFLCNLLDYFMEHGENRSVQEYLDIDLAARTSTPFPSTTTTTTTATLVATTALPSTIHSNAEDDRTNLQKKMLKQQQQLQYNFQKQQQQKEKQEQVRRLKMSSLAQDKVTAIPTEQKLSSSSVDKKSTVHKNHQLQQLHLERLERQQRVQPPPLPQAAFEEESRQEQNSKPGKKKKKSKSKSKSKSRDTSLEEKCTPAQDNLVHDDDDDFLTQEAAKARTCKMCTQSVTVMGKVCHYCSFKFCFLHW